VSKTEHKCETCGEPAEFRGWLFEAPEGKGLRGRWKRLPSWWCQEHYVAMMFGLYPYRCTEQCRKRRERITGIQLRRDSMRVWLQLETLLDETGCSTPHCPWCGKRLKSASWRRPKH
jgi:hypothetical protein